MSIQIFCSKYLVVNIYIWIVKCHISTETLIKKPYNVFCHVTPQTDLTQMNIWHPRWNKNKIENKNNPLNYKNLQFYLILLNLLSLFFNISTTQQKLMAKWMMKKKVASSNCWCRSRLLLCNPLFTQLTLDEDIFCMLSLRVETNSMRFVRLIQNVSIRVIEIKL